MKESKRKICFVISSLSHGGAERVTANLANYWAESDQYEIHIILIGTVSNAFYSIHKDVTIHSLNLLSESKNIAQAIINNLARVLRLRRVIAGISPDGVISFMFATNVLVIFSSFLMHWKLVISERNDPRNYKEGRKIWNTLRKLTYKYADALVVQNPPILSLLRKFNNHSVIIPNPAIPPKADTYIEKKTDRKVVVAMGSLVEQKGFDTLLNAFSLAQKNIPNFYLKIIGEGTLKSKLEDQTRKLGIQELVRFLGLVQNPANEFQTSDIFILSSRYEGSPNALIEAMSFGLACISTDCPSGPADLIQDHSNGLLVPVDDSEAMASALINMANSPELRHKCSLNALQISQKFELSRVAKMWENLIFRDSEIKTRHL